MKKKLLNLKELWGKGSTASQIAEIIGGISRNAVIGKAHRLNLSSKIKTRNASSSQNFDKDQKKNIHNKDREKRVSLSLYLLKKILSQKILKN